MVIYSELEESDSFSSATDRSLSFFMDQFLC